MKPDEYITWGDLYTIIEEIVEKVTAPKGRFVTRGEIVSEIGRAEYDRAVRKGHLTKIKGQGRTGRIKISRKEYEQYIKELR